MESCSICYTFVVAFICVIGYVQSDMDVALDVIREHQTVLGDVTKQLKYLKEENRMLWAELNNLKFKVRDYKEEPIDYESSNSNRPKRERRSYLCKSGSSNFVDTTECQGHCEQSLDILHSTRQITFDVSFTGIPIVHVGIAGINVRSKEKLQVGINTSNITCSGFTLNTDLYSDVSISGLHVNWLACSV